jgi:putative adhesin
MYRRTIKTLILAVALSANSYALGQETPKPAPKPAPKVAPASPMEPLPEIQAPKAKVYGQTSDVQTGPITKKIAQGTRIAVTSKTVNVKIIGVDGDTLQAAATSEAGAEPLMTQVSGESSTPRILLYVPASAPRRARVINLEVKIPRYAEVESVESSTGEIDVSGMDAPVAISNGTGTVKVNRVGSLKVTTRGGEIIAKEIKGDLIARSTHGDMTIENVNGTVDVAATSGNVAVRNAAGDVRANMSAGDIDVHCVKGRAELNSASGSIIIIGATGDVEATTASGDVTFKGAIRANGRYRLKSISGEVGMFIQPDAPGFTATLITYSGDIETAFPLKVETPLQGGPINRRISGRFGNGGTQITLDSFSGAVGLSKGSPAEWRQCK